ncbi:MAG: hypothetical protein ACTSQJ_13585 [Promethearchaeota archaeon]
MNDYSNNDENEMKCYLKILNYFQKKSDKREDIELWKSKSLMKLMDILMRTQNRKLITNALILMITLFENIPPDIYNNRGIHINRLSGKDKRALISALKEEFLPN